VCHGGRLARNATVCSNPAMIDFEKSPPEVKDLLGRRISSLGLKVEGSPVERSVERLRRELVKKGIRCFKATVYLTDEWGCPSGEPVIGIPFYLADPALQRLEGDMNDLESEREIMMFLRHEAGHAFNYAYRLYATPEWRELFGPFNRRYRDDYKPVPFSRKFVRHMAGWYAQKHPDEDFAETFAVWLTPRSAWRKRYKGWPAIQKLRYVERVVKRFGNVEPIVGDGSTDHTVEEMELTVGEFYRQVVEQNRAAVDLAMDGELKDMFSAKNPRRKNARPASDFVLEHRVVLTDKITYWTGVKRPLVRGLVENMVRHARDLDLWVEKKREAATLIELTAYGTTLAMNYLTRGKFVHV
jgi:hypothetical protein